MDQNTKDEAVIQIVDAMWHMVEHFRDMSRSLNMIERRGIQIHLDIPKEDGIAKTLKKRIWPNVDKYISSRKNQGLTHLRNLDKVIAGN